MTEGTLVAIIAGIASVGVALFAFIGIWLGLLWRKFTYAQATNNSLWLYTRVLIDAYFRDVKQQPPPPPDYIAHLYNTGAPS